MTDSTLDPQASGPRAFDALTELALDLRWSFNHAADRLWQKLDPELWELTHNPWVVLRTVSRDRLQSVRADEDFQKLVASLQREKQAAEQSKGWFQTSYPQSALTAVAYFSMEFMLSEALPIYSGGLGNVAGDQLKAASNLGVPVIGVGLLYQQGYFRQEIDTQGWQEALYPFNDPGQLPIQPVREANGEWLRFPLDFRREKVWIRSWQVRVGRAKLYLLDTNDPANAPMHRAITSELYGGGPEMRLRQELVLGIGGWRLLRAMGVQPQVCHLNEGHAAFAVLERARSHMEDHKQPFELAFTITRAGNLFTTHTPVEAGFDRFSPDLMEKYLLHYVEEGLSIPFKELLALGRRDANDLSEPFNMAYFATHGSGAVNGVSELHGRVSRQIFQVLFPRWPEEEVPVTYVTNGVHTPSWDSEQADRVWEAECGKERWRGTTEHLERGLRCATDSNLWQFRTEARKALVNYVRKKHAQWLVRNGGSSEEIDQTNHMFNADTLTLGFARRFATYKRPNLLLHDPERLKCILTNQDRPVQLVLAGKAHPQDKGGQEMIRQWILFSRQPEVRPHVVFLTDYDVLMAEHLIQGVDVWINTPRRPWEASGTSGMKVLVNGGLNLSELDGWWAEAYTPDVGWAIGDMREHGDDPAWDAAEAESVYRLLEQEVIPEFYARSDEGLPVKWIARMRESMARLTPTFSANRVVRQYTEEHYLPGAAAFLQRSKDRGKLGSDLLHWKSEVARDWSLLRFGTASCTQKEAQYLFQVQLYLDELDPDSVKVELFAEGQSDSSPIRLAMTRGERLVGSSNGFLYTGYAPANRPASDYTPRAVPNHEGALVPLEAPFILWSDSVPWR